MYTRSTTNTITARTTKDSSWLNFISSFKPGSERTTKRGYSRHLIYFKEWMHVKNFDDLLIDDTNKQQSRRLEGDIMKFLDYLQTDMGLSKGTREITVNALKRFYNKNYVQLHWYSIEKHVGVVTQEDYNPYKNRGYIREQIADMLKVTDLKIGAMILLMLSTGFRIGVLHKLNVGHLYNMKDYGYPDIYRIGPIWSKTRMVFSYCTPECFKAINAYLDYRRRGDGIHHDNITNESALFVYDFGMRHDRTIKNEARRIKNIEHPKRLGDMGIRGTIRNMLIESGVIKHRPHQDSKRPTQKRNEIPMNHGFRKFFETAMRNSGVLPGFIDLLEGHSMKLGEHYYDLHNTESQQEIIDQYVKAIPKLTIIDSDILRTENIELKTTQADRISKVEEKQASRDLVLTELLRYIQEERAEKANKKTFVIEPEKPALPLNLKSLSKEDREALKAALEEADKE